MNGMKEKIKEEERKYTIKISPLIYEPKGECPLIEQLLDRKKADELIKEIDKIKNISKSEKLFLKYAAERHVIFNYRNIAEYYCHANDSVKCMFEKMALVIIDFNNAIENGFIKMTTKFQEYIDKAIENDEEKTDDE